MPNVWPDDRLAHRGPRVHETRDGSRYIVTRWDTGAACSLVSRLAKLFVLRSDLGDRRGLTSWRHINVPQGLVGFTPRVYPMCVGRSNGHPSRVLDTERRGCGQHNS